eukprot:scaffold16859_cov18-Tisochrysis_lutea.AAC.3
MTQCRVDMTSEATAARNAGSAPTTLSLRPQHFHEPDALLVFRCVFHMLLAFLIINRLPMCINGNVGMCFVMCVQAS